MRYAVDAIDNRATVGMVADTLPFSMVDGPGNRFVVFMQGCNFDCVACHNPHTIRRTTGEHFRTTVDDVLEQLRPAAAFVSGITVTGGEATLQPDFLLAVFEAMESEPALARLTRFVDSNGSTDIETWIRLAPHIQGAMLDLKCFDPEIHQRLTGHSNAAVLKAIRYLHSMELLYEVRLLIIEGVNDDPMLLRRTGHWLAAIDPAMRLKVIGFREHGVRPCQMHLVEPDREHLQAAADALQVAEFEISII
jgi:pyruvate-formate lyase-activating enzyme